MSATQVGITNHPYTVVELHYCLNCGKLGAKAPGIKYCPACCRTLLAPDPIDIAIAEMIREQEAILRNPQGRIREHRHVCPTCRTTRKCSKCTEGYFSVCAEHSK